jgi:atypical dual specificity phosphatase
MTVNAGRTMSKGFFSIGSDAFQLPTSLPLKIAYGVFASGALVFFLFQKRLLPKGISKIVSKIFFLPTFPITILMRLGNYWTNIDDTLLLGCAPIGILGHPSQLHKLGVRGVINMCYEYNGPKGYYSALGIKQLHLPTVDHFEPTLSQMTEAVRFIQEYKNKGERVYVHCKGGHGRAASIAMCWMMNELPDVAPKVRYS